MSADTTDGWWEPEEVTARGGKYDFEVMEHPLLDGDDKSADAQERLKGAVQATRFRRFLGDPSTTNAHPNLPAHRWFHGYCVENTAALIDELDRRDIEWRPVTGSNRDDIHQMCPVDARGIHEIGRRSGALPHEHDDYLAGQPPSTAEESYRHGSVHHWVEARLDGLWWTVDAFQYRFDETDGKPFIGLSKPSAYVTYPDSREFGAEYFESIREHYDVNVIAPSVHKPDRHPDSWLHGP